MIKKGDFIELDYTARLKDDKLVFDTTDEGTAKSAGIYSKNYKYIPVIICVGEHHLIPGLDKALMGKALGKFTINIDAEEGFGKKRADLLKLLPLRLFKKDEVQPFPGLEVNVDGQVGIVKTVSGGRVIVDFNHPLSSKELVYDVDVKRLVTDPLEKVKAILEIMHFPFEAIDIIDEKADIQLKSMLPEEITGEIANELKRLVGLKEANFSLFKKKEEKKAEDSQEGHEHHDASNHEGHEHMDHKDHESHNHADHQDHEHQSHDHPHHKADEHDGKAEEQARHAQEGKQQKATNPKKNL